MNILYSSTRGANVRVTASEAIIMGLAPDGGLFVPHTIPTLDRPLRDLASLSYQDLAYEVMQLFFTDYTEEELRDCICKAYGAQFDTEEIAELSEAGDAYYLELYHGPTIAFKDMALQLLPHLMTCAMKKKGLKNEIVILTATSGDTGKAALAGFADVPGTKIIVFYPDHGVSRIQELQMVTQEGENTCVIGIEGNFDDAQTGVKKMFTDALIEREMAARDIQFSSANSINIGRLVPQIVYYVYAYCKLLKEGRIEDDEAINIAVPTGNFGNILAAYYARRMGLPVHKLICASNVNKVLTDFFASGIYDRNREFLLTTSPSMDILVSSNLERLIYYITGENADQVAEFMHRLNLNGTYEITDEMRAGLKDFYAGYATEEEDAAAIRDTFTGHGYLIDPHTAVACAVYKKYRAETNDTTKTVIASTANPYKFTHAVMDALGHDNKAENDFELAEEMCSLTGMPVPEAVTRLKDAKIRHHITCERAEMKKQIRAFLELGE